MIDHISLQVTNFAAALSFYKAALAPLGYEAHYVDESAKSAGFGPRRDAGPWFARGSLWIAEGKPAAKTHLALTAPSRDAVAKFHAAAVRAGGKDNGKPGIRADYHANYYAAFVFDPDGNNLEAVTHVAA
jgi:catechol 2,3-dioxygenase-like lactoylglutathione lyase family enzyme